MGVLDDWQDGDGATLSYDDDGHPVVTVEADFIWVVHEDDTPEQIAAGRAAWLEHLKSRNG